MSSVEIRPFSKRNGITLTIIGTILVCLGIGLFVSSSDFFAIGLTCFSLGTIALIMGVAKVFEPASSLVLDQEGLVYHHRRGRVAVQWRQIQRVDVVRVNDGLALTELPFVGIKLKCVSAILETISPRLATGLLTEQRPLMMTAAAQDSDISALEAQMGLEFSPLVIEEQSHAINVEAGQKEFTGVLAMFGHRSLMLDKYLGYHLYIPIDSLDREPQAFVDTLRCYLNNLNSG